MQESHSNVGNSSEVVVEKDLVREIVDDVIVTKEVEAKQAKKPEKKAEKGGVIDEAVATAAALFADLEKLAKANPSNQMYRQAAHQAKILQMVLAGQY